MKKVVPFICVLSVCLLIMAGPCAASDARNAVVKVFVTSNRHDFYRPWQSKGSSASTGSGCVISDGRILTNAHVVSDSTFIQVRKESDPNKFTARLEAIGHDCDLAILTVDDPEFYKGIVPLEIGDLPQLQDKVSVIGFPRGGDKLSITQGVVSRLEINPYAQSAKKLLTVQIDAAINPGNSGGPVVKDNKLVGVAMQLISNSQNIGYMIPTPIIKHFLQDLADGTYAGFPILGIEFSNTENKTLRRYLKIEDQKGGVLVTRPLPFSSADGMLQEDDVVLQIDGIPIGVDGTFEFRQEERLLLSYLINDKQDGDSIKLKISRNGKIMTKDVIVRNFTGLIPAPMHFEKPSYYVYGGMIFTVLSADLLKSWGKNWWKEAPLDFMFYLVGKGRLNPDRKKEIVTVLEILPDDITVGYHHYHSEVIAKVNGRSFASFEEFVKMVDSSKDKTLIFETDQGAKIFLDNANIDEITAQILSRNNIPRQYSEDVAGWLGKPALP